MTKVSTEDPVCPSDVKQDVEMKDEEEKNAVDNGDVQINGEKKDEDGAGFHDVDEQFKFKDRS